MRRLDEGALRALVPRVLASLVRRGEDFDAAEDALQEALLEALRVWPEHPPRDGEAWLATGAAPRGRGRPRAGGNSGGGRAPPRPPAPPPRSGPPRPRREEATSGEPRPAETEEGDDT